MANVDESFAVIESDQLSSGRDAVVASGQDHVLHAQDHLGKAQQILDALAQGQISPEQAYQGIVKLGQHTAQHLALLEGNPMRAQEYQALKKQLDDLSKIADALAQQIQDAQDQPSPQQQLSEEGQIGLAKVQQDGALKQQKFQTDSALKVRKQAFTERMQAVKTASELGRAQEKHKQQLQLTR